VLEGEHTLALWGDPLRPGGRALLTRALRRSAAVGPAVPWREAVRSLRLARVLARLAADEPDEPGKSDEPGTPDDRGQPRWVADHLGLVALHDPDGALSALSDARLRPFEDLSERTRARLQLTLLTWLEQQGSRAGTARALGVHEQTVRYRLKQLRELLPDALDDPQARFEVELSLRAEVVRQGAARA
jgi:hypothetical protein